MASGKVIEGVISAVNPGLGWLLRTAGAAEVISDLLAKLLDWKAGQVKLLGAEAVLQGSAGIGAQLDAELGFAGGKLTFKCKAGVTFGLGAGVTVNLSIDAVEGVKFAIVAIGKADELVAKLANLVKNWAHESIDDLIREASGLWGDLFNWLSSDNKIREAVAKKAHEVVPADVRGQWIETLSKDWCGGADEAAMVEILRFSQKNGDLAQVLAAGLSKEEIIKELQGLGNKLAAIQILT